MRCVVLHESSKRIRMKTPLIHMSYRDADLLQYYIASLPEVKEASVDERTGNAVVNFRKASSDNKERLMKALLAYDPEDEAVTSLVPEETGRKLNREYQEKFIMQVLKHNLYKLFLPTPISIARTVVKSVPFLIKWREMLKSYSGWFNFRIKPAGYVKMFGFVFIGYLIVMLLDFRRIKKIPMDQALKNVE